MAALIQNFSSGISGLVNMAHAKLNPFKVEAVQRVKLTELSVVEREGAITLYQRKSALSTFECIITKPDVPTKMFSLFRQTNEIDAKVLFKTVIAVMGPIVGSCLIPVQEDNLQKIMDCINANRNWTSAHVAANLGYYTCLKYPGIIEFRDEPSKIHLVTPLMAAIIGRQGQSVEELLRLGADISKKDQNGNTVFHYAVKHCPLVVSILADYDRSNIINCMNRNGDTALMMACQLKVSDATEILIGAGADPKIGNADYLPIHAAVKSKDMRSAEAIIKAFPEQANARDFKYGGTPIHWAQSTECIQKLAVLGCDFNNVNKEGNSPLHIMMKTKSENRLALLCHGADCNIRDSSGETVLHKAIREGDLEQVRQYILFGADVNQLTRDGHSPRHLASTSKKKNWENILYLLHESGAKRCGKQTKGCQLGCAAEKSYNGIPDQSMSTLLNLDDVALSDDLMMSYAACSTPEQKLVEDMTAPPSSTGDRVLCLDGGGIRGLVLIEILLKIEAYVGKPIRECFDWIGGTSTGAFLALGIARGLSLNHMKGLYIRLKDEVFKGKRPYDSGPFEEMLKKVFGEDDVMSDIKYPKLLVTAVLADRHPAELFFFRNFEKTLHREKPSATKLRDPEKKPSEQKIWEAARSSGAAPTYFRAFGSFLDGGLIANNPTLDVLTEISEYNLGLKLMNRSEEIRPIGCVVSVGCGRIATKSVENMDVFLPQGLLDVYKAVSGATALGRLVIDKATESEGRPVDRARAWCSMVNIPYYRFSPPLSEDIALDCHDTKLLFRMMWETHCYMMVNQQRLPQLASLLGCNVSNINAN